MKLCYIGKYFPIQGGVSRTNYWLMLALAQRGVEVHIVTNANEVEDEFRLLEYGGNPLQHPNLTVHYTRKTRQTYIPWAPPYVTKLATVATDVIREHQCDLIYSHYFEPYGMAAHLASCWTGVPYGIRHAGSDVGGLFLNPEQYTAYKQMVLAADYVLVSSSTWRRFLHLGVDQERIYFPIKFALPDQYFNPQTEPLDVNALLAYLRDNLAPDYLGGAYHESIQKPFDPSLPTIGIYGKTGRVKGSFDLVQALGRLKREGEKFNFLALTQSHPFLNERFAQAIKEKDLESCTWLLPFIPHWQVAKFIRACTAICFLERNFSIKIHTPTVPREVFACGTGLILSHEIAKKQHKRSRIVHGETALLVDPQDEDELSSVLRQVIHNPDATRAMGLRGHTALSEEDFVRFGDLSLAWIKNIYDDVQYRKLAMSMSEMQACLARLYVDEPFRKYFFLDPDDALKNYKLTEQEKVSLQGIDRVMMTHFAGSLKAKRKRKFEVAYKFLFDLNGSEMNRFYDRYYALYPARPGEKSTQQVIDFGTFIEQTLVNDSDFPPYAVDVARYARLLYISRYVPTDQDDFQFINDDTKTTLAPLSPTTQPFLQDRILLGEFDYNIIELIKQLKQEETPKDWQGQQFLVFQQIPNTLQPNVFGITPATFELLKLCKGNTVEEITSKIEQQTGRANLQDQVIHILHQLQQKDLISWN